jgi:topoisomerase IA-like protein
VLEKKIDKPQKNVLRKLNEELSVRKGKYGPYVYYKTPEMSKPQFLNIKKFKEGFLSCDVHSLINWLKETYNI